jgi:hypothetical protein
VRQVRAEVDRLRDLSEELVTLKGQLAPPPVTSLPAPAPAPAPPPRVVAPRVPNGRSQMPRSETSRTPQEPTEPSPSFPNSAPGAPEEPKPVHRPAPGEDPLVMVTRRIAQIRSEQRSRWQRILDLVRVGRQA